MLARIKASALVALCATAVSAGLAGCDGDSPEDGDQYDYVTEVAMADPFTGTKKIKVEGRSVNVSCSGTLKEGKVVIVLLPGMGNDLKKMAPLQRTLSKKNRVCSYDRPGEGSSSKPKGPQDLASTGKILTGVLQRVAGTAPAVLAGHSLGGLIAARYAPDHQDKVAGLVMMDATPPTMVADITTTIPESATGPAADVRARNLAAFEGQNPEKLVITDGKVRSAGDIPVEVITHGKPHLAAIPEYGQALERAWSAGQRKWLAVSSRSKLSTATKSGHDIYVDQPDVAVKAIERVTAQAVRHAAGE